MTIDILRLFFERNKILEVERGGCFHVIELTYDHVVLKGCSCKHEIKYYFDKDEHLDMLFCEALHRLPNSKLGNQGIGIDLRFDVYRSDIFDEDKDRQTLKDIIAIIEDTICLRKRYGFELCMYPSDMLDLIDDVSGVDKVLRLAHEKNISLGKALVKVEDELGKDKKKENKTDE